MRIQSEQIGSIPRSRKLIEAYASFEKGVLSEEELDILATKETIRTIKELESTGSYMITDGEQRKFNGFTSYCLHCSKIVKEGSVGLKFEDGHIRTMPELLEGPFKYNHYAYEHLRITKDNTDLEVKQAIISPSMMSLVYPKKGLKNYSKIEFIQDLIHEHVKEIKGCLDMGAAKVQIDFTEARFSLKLDPSGELLRDFVDLINLGLENLTEEERKKIGIHTCPGADLDRTHSADIDYKYLLPSLMEINVGNFYVAMSSEKEPEKALRLIGKVLKPSQIVFVGVVNPIDRHIESPEMIRDRIIHASKFIPLNQLGTTDDCGFSPFTDDLSTSRSVAYSKIKNRIEGTKLAEHSLYNS